MDNGIGFVAGLFVMGMIAAFIGLIFNLQPTGEMREACEKANNVYRCEMVFVPAAAVEKLPTLFTRPAWEGFNGETSAGLITRSELK